MLVDQALEIISYNESITSNKSLSLIGENQDTTIIQGIYTSNLATLFLTGN